MVGGGLTPTGRLFVAVVPPAEVAMALADRLDSLSIPGRHVPPINWHITLRFVGRVDAVTYDRWLASLEQVEGEPLRMRLEGLGAFPRPQSATVVWVGVMAPGIERLAAMVEEATQRAGIPAEERPFRPHLTLARVRPPVDARAVVERADLGPGLTWRADRFSVMAAAGSRYEIYETFAFA